MIVKMLLPHNLPLWQLTREEEVSEVLLSRGHSAAPAQGKPRPKDQSGLKGWTVRDKFAVVVETEALNEAESPVYCRERGLYSEQIQTGRVACEWGQAASHQITKETKGDKKRIRDQVITTCNSEEIASRPARQIVPRLAGQGEYIVSESSFCRVLRERGQSHRRGRARPSSRFKLSVSFEAKGPCEVWFRDITWLPGPALGMFFYLYLIVGIFSRKIVGWEVHERETSEFAASLLERAVWAERCVSHPLTLHADNGSPMKGAIIKVTMERLGVTASFCRPRVSNDNPFSESLFWTCKCVPSCTSKNLASIDDARLWMQAFVTWYNTKQRHSAIRFVTQDQRHRGVDVQMLVARRHVYQVAEEWYPDAGFSVFGIGSLLARYGLILSGLKPNEAPMMLAMRSPIKLTAAAPWSKTKNV